MRTRIATLAMALVSLTCIGYGLGWWVHPGLGLLVVGFCLWIDLTINSIIARATK